MITRKEEEKLENFFERGEFLVAPEHMENPEEFGCYLWEDFQLAGKFLLQNPDIHAYTLLDDGTIVEGAHFVNRFAYLLSATDAGLKENSQLRFW
jgi:hypothetical protein